jgi:AcrR family transcriptional regulator
MMSVSVVRDRRAERFATTRREILEAAWALARSQGLVSFAMRDLGAAVGMRAQSLYAYFPSKNAMYDAMFADANRELLVRFRAIDIADPVQALRAHGRAFVEFCVQDHVRYQLLFQRTIPGFEPSPESYAVAVEVLADARARVVACGARGARAFDAWTALTGGLAAQQNANEPAGRRWVRLLDELVDMYLAHFGKDSVRRGP